MARKLFALVLLAAFLTSPAAGFDTYWHSQCSQKVGEQFGFSEDAWKIMQLGDFSPDFFGPVSEYASKNLKGKELGALTQYEADNQQVRGAAVQSQQRLPAQLRFRLPVHSPAAEHQIPARRLQQAQT